MQAKRKKRKKLSRLSENEELYLAIRELRSALTDLLSLHGKTDSWTVREVLRLNQIRKMGGQNAVVCYTKQT